MERSKPQAFQSSYAPRLRAYNNSLLTPVLQSAPTGPVSRTTKRGTTIINYAEDGFDELDDDSDDARRRPSGLRSLRKEDSVSRQDAVDRAGKDTKQPVHLQAIWRDWMGKNRAVRSEQQNTAQAALPLTLIPIRIDLDVPSFVPPPAFPPPNPNAVDPSLPQYRPGEMTVPYKLRDIFCWNLHETLITTDQFAQVLAQDLDLPNRAVAVAEISKQIRTQLEEYAGVALHPLFHTVQQQQQQQQQRQQQRHQQQQPQPPSQPPASVAGSPASLARGAPSRPETPATPYLLAGRPSVTAEATPMPADDVNDDDDDDDDDDLNPDDAYRCIITLNVNLSSTLYTDKFEWSLLHPPGTAEAFAKVTCADLGLAGEWVPAMTHAIYEAVLRLKKEACEAGGIVTGWGGPQQDVPNDAANGAEAGWRYDPEHLADDWEPKVELLSKEEMEKREGDRERQIRRLRRETARFSSAAFLTGTASSASASALAAAAAAAAAAGSSTPLAASITADILPPPEEERMGRGERSKKKRRFRSLSPLARGATPAGRGTPDAGAAAGAAGASAAGAGAAGALSDAERGTWRCAHCCAWGSGVWAVRDGPCGPKSLCANCAFFYERDGRLPRPIKNLHLTDPRIG
ncbi:snf5/smarcb1/ini1 [Ophiocordyceps camponoti-floridani]|uniref:Snf5/smarcb1/ini1 n=1 Tax=Ophiocordyceps camponoti-floridani TaxID=2030778 RepID=A0A8H4VG75_9HYPO|nr:snf5/smarcb1/ini1 [Ophiocordyceps camponoti-floridani]